METFLASLKDPIELHHANNHPLCKFPIEYVVYLSSLWMSFKGHLFSVCFCARAPE